MRLKNWYTRGITAVEDADKRRAVGLKHIAVEVFAKNTKKRKIGFYVGRKEDIDRLKRTGRYIIEYIET